MVNPTCGFTKYEVRCASFKNILNVLIKNLKNVSDDDCQRFLGNCISAKFFNVSISHIARAAILKNIHSKVGKIIYRRKRPDFKKGCSVPASGIDV